MLLLAHIIQIGLPIVALILLVWGIIKKAIYYIISALWLSLIALIIHYQNFGGEILGSYFDYTNACIYSLNLIVLASAIISIIAHLSTETGVLKYFATLSQALIVLASVLIISNLWINASFIADKMEGTPIIQVALMKKPSYCNYKYIFYKIAQDGSTDYLCPNYYGLIPKVGHLAVSPDFVATQLSLPNKKQLLLLQKKQKEN